MHHARGLVRRAGRQGLHALESQQVSPASSVQGCVHRVQLLDVRGSCQHTMLLHSGALLKLVKDMPSHDALVTVDHVSALLESQNATTVPAAGMPAHQPSPESSTAEGEAPMPPPTTAPPSLYVKDDAAEACTELQQRQRRFLAKLRGRFCATDSAAVEAALDVWLATPQDGFDDAAGAQYSAMVESLAVKDAAAAVALAINPALPPLSPSASAALADLVQLHTPSAVHAFLESFATRDDAAAAAADTCATHLAVRLRREAANSTTPTGDVTAHLREAASFSIDPGVVYPAEPAAIQAWADQFLRHDMLPADRAAAVLREVCRRRLQPRRVSMDSLSVWTLSDLERPWLRFALETSGAGSASAAANGSAFVSTAYQLALKDVRRNLVDNRLLLTYAAALARGDISPLEESFGSFVEECGECHSGAGAERPAVLRFTLPRVPAGVPLRRALHDLAPQSSYWRTLMDRYADTHVRAATAPRGEMLVEVQLPTEHECVVAAASGVVAVPPIPVLYEDADVMVVNKPAGLATSRHGLSGTQLGSPVTDLISALLSTGRNGAALSQVFRQGQVHRLDVETSGCLLIAKTDTAADSLRHQVGTAAAFSHHSKIYHALCLVLEPSLRHIRLRDEVADLADPKIRTRYRVIRFFPRQRVAWVECRIQQGKKHQIRRHLASRGFPILGDVEHGGAACCQPMINRVALHAHSLSFVHAVTAEPLTVVAPLPDDFRRCLVVLRGDGGAVRRGGGSNGETRATA